MPGRGSAGEFRVRRVPRHRFQHAVRHRGLARVDRVVEVVGRLGGRVVVQRHPVLGGDRFGGDEAAVARPEPALGGAVAVVVHSRPARVADLHGEHRAVPDRGLRRDHQLVGRALLPVLGVRGGVGVRELGRARRGQGVVLRAAHRVVLRDLVRLRVGVVLAVRIARVGRLDEREGGRVAVDRDRADRHVGSVRRVGGLALEVQAEAGQALRGPVGEHDVVAGQELVRRGVVHQVHVRVDAGVAAVARVRVDVGPVRGQRVRAVRARQPLTGGALTGSALTGGRPGRPGQPRARQGKGRYGGERGEQQSASCHRDPPESWARPGAVIPCMSCGQACLPADHIRASAAEPVPVIMLEPRCCQGGGTLHCGRDRTFSEPLAHAQPGNC